MDALVLRDLENRIRTDVPEFKVEFKDESPLMKVLGFLSYPFNPKFTTTYTTTWGTTVYFPSRATYEQNVSNSFGILTHEYVHLWDKKQSKLFGLSYAFPQLLALVGLVAFAVLAWPHSWLVLLPVLGYLLAALVGQKTVFGFGAVLGAFVIATGVLAVWLTGWAAMTLGVTLAFLVPWPAPWRTKWELRGYTMTLAVSLWFGNSYTPELREHLVGEFLGSSYYFMNWSRSTIEQAFDEAAALVTSGGLQGRSPPYAAVYDFLYQHSLLRR